MKHDLPLYLADISTGAYYFNQLKQYFEKLGM